MIKKDLIVFTLVNIKIQIMISKLLNLMLNVKGRLFSYLSLLKGIKAIKLKIISKGPKRQESNQREHIANQFPSSSLLFKQFVVRTGQNSFGPFLTSKLHTSNLQQILYCAILRKTVMEPENTLNQQLNSDGSHIENILSQLPALPLSHKKLQSCIKKLQQEQKDKFTERLQSLVHDTNLKAIQSKFIQMMQQVFLKIDPELKYYKEKGNIGYLDTIICRKCSELEPKIYHNGYELHKPNSNPMENLRFDEMDTLEKMFTEIFDIMNELLTTMKIHYGYQKSDEISEALYESISIFSEKKQDCFLVTEDRRSFIQAEQNKQTESKENGSAPYDILLDVMGAITLDKQNLTKGANKNLWGQAKNLLSVVYKYAVNPVLGYTYDVVKNINPLATNQVLTDIEKQNFRLSLIQNLSPNESLKDPLDQKVNMFTINLKDLDLKTILSSIGSKEKQQLMEFAGNILNDFENPNQSLISINKEIMSINNLIIQNEEECDQIDLFSEFREVRWIFIFFKALEKNYSSERRRLMFKICHHSTIKSKLQNSIKVLKHIESLNLTENNLLVSMRHLQVAQKNPNVKFDPKEIKSQDFNITITLELQRIQLRQLKIKKSQQVPLIVFSRLTKFGPKKIVTFVFSGFMSEDTCKVEEWNGLLETMYDSEVYAIRWESKSYGSVLDFAVDAIKDIASANLKIGILGSIGGPYVRAIALIREIYKKYNDNPFNPAFQSAEKTGIYMAQLFMANFQGHLFNLIGFSLGTEVIKSILIKMAEKNSLKMLNKIYMMGGPTDISEIQAIIQRSPTPITIINLYSKNDHVLKYLLKVCKPSINPIGLGQIPQIEGHNIRNQDCSAIIDGHLAYRSRMSLLGKLLNIKDD